MLDLFKEIQILILKIFLNGSWITKSLPIFETIKLKVFYSIEETNLISH